MPAFHDTVDPIQPMWGVPYQALPNQSGGPTGAGQGDLTHTRPPRPPRPQLPGTNVVDMQGRTVIPQQMPRLDNYQVSPGQSGLPLGYKNQFVSKALKNLKRNLRANQLGILTGFRDTAGVAILQYANAEQHYRDAKRALAQTATDRAVMAGRADARALRPMATIEQAQRLAQPTYLPKAPNVALPTPQAAMPTVNIPSDMPESTKGSATQGDFRSTSSSPAGDFEVGRGSIPSQSTPGINPVSAAAPSIFNAIANGLQAALNNGLASLFQSNPQPRFQYGQGPKTQPFVSYPPGTNPSSLTPSNAPGVASQPSNFASINPEPEPEPEPQPEANAKCECKKGESPKRKKGKCGQGYFKQSRDGTTEYKFWSNRKCPS